MQTNDSAIETGATPPDEQTDGTGSTTPPSAPNEPTGASAPDESSASDSEPAPGAASAQAEGGFFAWLRDLRVPRRDGWLGGVCAGVAARIGIDPIIVRGVVVVAAILGAPFVLLYAIAWLLLPDTSGRIHLERLLRGDVDGAVVGIAVMGLIGLLPFLQGGWLGWQWWGGPAGFTPLGLDLGWMFRLLWTLAVITAIGWFVYWLIHRVGRSQRARAGGVPDAASGAAAASASPSTNSTTTSATATTPGVEPPVPADGATPDEIAAWRVQHEQWRHSHAEWRGQQGTAEREARARAAVENKAAARALVAQADAARAARRAARPRASAAYVFATLGLALVGGAGAAIIALNEPTTMGAAPAIGFAVAVLVIATGMLVSALRRQRSGFLTFVGIVATLGMIGAASVPSAELLAPNATVRIDASADYTQPVGNTWITIDGTANETHRRPHVELTKLQGDVYIEIYDGKRLALGASGADYVQITTLPAGDQDSTTEVYGSTTGTTGDRLIVGGTDGQATDVRLDLYMSATPGAVYISVHEGAAR